MAFEYKQQKNDEAKRICDIMLEELPRVCRQYVISCERTISPQTQKTYVEKLKIFFEYLHENNSYFSKVPITEIKTQDLDKLEKADIEEFAHWVYNRTSKTKNGEKTNCAATVDVYLSALTQLWNYMLDEKMVRANPVSRVKRAKRKDREIIKLDSLEEESFMNSVYCGDGLSEKQQKAQQKNSERDIAIIRILLYTGLRVSELVGTNVEDYDLERGSVRIIRKRDKIDVIPFDDETLECIKEYLEIRNMYQPPDYERAMFLVGIGKYKGTRLSVRSIEKMVEKYAKAGVHTLGKKISPHKLRATYATKMLKATGNLDLVRAQLGHSDPKTTNIYAKTDNEEREKYRNVLIEQNYERR